jgi:hypothetical protein
MARKDVSSVTTRRRLTILGLGIFTPGAVMLVVGVLSLIGSIHFGSRFGGILLALGGACLVISYVAEVVMTFRMRNAEPS